MRRNPRRAARGTRAMPGARRDASVRGSCRPTRRARIAADCPCALLCRLKGMPRRALITGIGGQDGSYLAEFLLSKGYEVHGMVRRGSPGSLDRIAHIAREISIHAADLHDTDSLKRAIRDS